MKDKIILFNRDGGQLWLEHLKDNLWAFMSDNDSLFINYARFIVDKSNNIEAFDPPGGPYLAIGSKINNKYIIKFIDSDLLMFELEEIK